MSEAKARDKTQSSDTRVAHQVALEGINGLNALFENASTERKIEVGSILWELGDRIKEALDGIKGDVRTKAVQEMGGQVGSTTLDGDDMGEATVTIPAAVLRIPKGTSIDDIRTALGSKFPFFFEETVTHKPHKEYEARVEALDDALTQKVLLDAVERSELTPRVSFRRNRPSKRNGNGGK